MTGVLSRATLRGAPRAEKHCRQNPYLKGPYYDSRTRARLSKKAISTFARTEKIFVRKEVFLLIKIEVIHTYMTKPTCPLYKLHFDRLI